MRPLSNAVPSCLLSKVALEIEKLCPRSLHRGVPFALVIVAAIYTVVFLACATARLTFGFELAWLESGMQAMTDRLGAHQSIYAEPSPAYVPFIYPPLYYVVAHGIAVALPSLGQFTPMRLVSLLATLATALTVFVTLGRNPTLGLKRRALLAALFFAFYGRFEFWHDTSRVDSLFVCLLFSATVLLIEGTGMATTIAAGCLGGLAMLTKQPAAPLFVGAAVAVALTHWRRAMLGLSLSAASAILGLAILGELGNPWFYYYILRVPTTHAIVPHMFGLSALFLGFTMPLFLLVAGTVLYGRAKTPALAALDQPLLSSLPRRRDTNYCWALTFAIWLGVIVFLRLKEGASLNFFLPLVPVGIVVIASAFERLGNRCEPLLLVQFLILLYNPLSAIPTAADWRAGFELLGSLRQIPGDIFLPQFPTYLAMVGKPPVAHGVAVCDLSTVRPELLHTIRAQIDEGHYAAALPWAAEGRSTDNSVPCRPQKLGFPFRLVETIPQGGSFFASSHGAQVAGIYLFDPDSKAPR